MFYLLLLAALGCALLLWRQPRGAGRALIAGAGVLFLAAALMLLLRQGFLPGHGRAVGRETHNAPLQAEGHFQIRNK